MSVCQRSRSDVKIKGQGRMSGAQRSISGSRLSECYKGKALLPSRLKLEQRMTTNGNIISFKFHEYALPVITSVQSVSDSVRGAQEKWSSQLAHILVWNGGFKIGTLCGCVCTQKGGQNERFTHNMGSLSQMFTQTAELCVEWYIFV